MSVTENLDLLTMMLEIFGWWLKMSWGVILEIRAQLASNLEEFHKHLWLVIFQPLLYPGHNPWFLPLDPTPRYMSSHLHLVSKVVRMKAQTWICHFIRTRMTNVRLFVPHSHPCHLQLKFYYQISLSALKPKEAGLSSHANKVEMHDLKSWELIYTQIYIWV